ncbi:GGDEF domain-containing protein [Mariprofundus erugo]|uniref:GGDEF domain-containing protein n=1 Tax=Mariprofundus erugo TaxID=2528639 RepID=UPI001EE95CC7|nr:diguanylate cyclase [Mariprofundus erugo]
MNTLREDPHRAVILGAGRGGTAILEMLMEEHLVSVVGIVDIDPGAPGLALARQYDIPVFHNAEEAMHACAPCVAFNMTHNEMLESVASEILGAGGVIGGMEAKLIWRIISNMKEAKAELHFQASHDALTGLYNRRHMMEQLHQGVSQALRYCHSYAVVMLDLDHFKRVNDEFGHAAGDVVLSAMASILRESVRDADIAGRWGGEEFLVLLPHTDLDGARRAAEQWLKRLAMTALSVGDDRYLHVSFSAGVATIEPADIKDAGNDVVKSVVEQLLHIADKRLYRAKEQGRNRVIAGDG